MLVQCCIPGCKRWLEPKPVDLGDDANGRTSHSYCQEHEAAATRDARQTLGLALDCESCGASLPLDGCCPRCGVAHDGGDACPTCGRFGFHTEDCTDPGDPWREAGPAALTSGTQFTDHVGGLIPWAPLLLLVPSALLGMGGGW